MFNINDFSYESRNNMVNRIKEKKILTESSSWNIENFDTTKKIGAELKRLHSEKEKHLEADDMPSMYYENIDKHIKELNDKMGNFDCECNEIKECNLSESRLPSDPNVDPQFGVPSQKKYPLFDEKHVRSAIKLFGHVDAEYEQQLARAIMAKMRKYGISYDEVGPDNKLYKWIPEAYKTKK